ncbi:MAG TPA: archaetidylserine decarboxylase [Myxococcaceae bacterium]|nr:archaetidylserine decarboxylase [Myxococcaceae bacterium]
MRDQAFMTFVRLLPKAALSRAVGMATRAPAPPSLHRLAMRAFSGIYGVALEEAEHGPEGYQTFSDFFARRLKPGARTVDADARAVVSPVDGTVSQVGYAETGNCLQAKGVCYPLDKLLGGAEAAAPFHGGAYATLYLAPRDYHRIHAPVDGAITGYSYIPGKFWPVNPVSVRSVEALFCINERLVTYLDTRIGPCAVVKVGATCVARIKAAYDSVVTNNGDVAKVHRYAQPPKVSKGDELGAFEMGSTVIVLFAENRVKWDSALLPETQVRMGQRIGEMA